MTEGERAKMRITPIAHIRTDFPEKFGIPRQPGVVEELKGRIVFEPEYRNPDMIRGLEEFSHIWLIWEFSKNLADDGSSKFSPTVRPPRLGGNKRIGVFATRSPFRPNPLGLSVVKIDHVEQDTPEGPVIYVKGADMVDGTPIYDIKPYIPYADSIPGAKGGFTDNMEYKTLKVEWNWDNNDIPKNTKINLEKILSNDPRPHYQNDPDRVYGMSYAGYEVKFKVTGEVLTVLSVTKRIT
ncbi:MAG: tRNA (N6-threonylcarbamoyladenosine(37)-N6)-methyltransferase TrmO [Lachnospiraceae bacterium]|nr:tRNA (N6-threonylcarbamoyladenosine(37)-N6)-methyltransferase TrmO [Lachnospiraceae bacterium]